MKINLFKLILRMDQALIKQALKMSSLKNHLEDQLLEFIKELLLFQAQEEIFSTKNYQPILILVD